MVLFLTKIFHDLLLLFLTLVNLFSVLLHSSPLIHISPRISGIVPLGLVVQALNLVRLLVKWLFDAISHLERVHYANLTSAFHFCLINY